MDQPGESVLELLPELDQWTQQLKLWLPVPNLSYLTRAAEQRPQQPATSAASHVNDQLGTVVKIAIQMHRKRLILYRTKARFHRQSWWSQLRRHVAGDVQDDVLLQLRESDMLPGLAAPI